jgi:hypothetical protein
MRLIIVIALVVALFPRTARPDDTGTVSIVGKNNSDASDPKTFGLTLILSKNTWTVAEPGNDTHFFKTKKGIYIYIHDMNKLFLCRENTVGDCARDQDSQVGNLTITVDPSKAKKGDGGIGQALETGIIFNWKVV